MAGPRLHKAAHYARRAFGDGKGDLQLRPTRSCCYPTRTSPSTRSPSAGWGRPPSRPAPWPTPTWHLLCTAVPLLPDDPYEPWAAPTRGRAGDGLHEDLLRLAGRWEDLLRANPVDEEAHLVLALQYADRGDQRAALRQLERMDQALRRELGTVPSDAARLLRAELVRVGVEPAATSPRPETARLVGRRDQDDYFRERMDRADSGHGSAVLLTGVPGVGKTALLDLAASLAGAAAGGSPAVARRPSRARGPMRRCWRRSRTSAAGIPHCSTGWTTTTATSSTAPWPARRSRGAARRRTSGCSSPRPS